MKISGELSRPPGLVIGCAVLGICFGVFGITISCLNYGAHLEKPGVLFERHMTLWFVMGYVCSALILAGGIGLLLRQRWGWWLSLAGYPVGMAAIVAILIVFGSFRPVLLIDLVISVIMIGWLLFIRRQFTGGRQA
jgi:lysylphosphatidylglycerol synthetase-like protein (DUF2156 family)